MVFITKVFPGLNLRAWMDSLKADMYIVPMRFFIIILLFLTLGCVKNVIQYEFADGNGNLYIISPTLISYIPVKPEESSSGMYSGGKPKSMPIKAEQFETIHALLKKAIGDSAIHIQDRVKMSGVISVVGKAERKQYILQPGSEELVAIDALLKEMLGS